MDYDPDAVRQGYAMGWIREEYKDGSSLVWHNGGIDGFTSYIEFLPQPDLGLVLNTMNPSPTGKWFYAYVLNVLLNQRLSLNLAVPGKALAANASAFDQLRQLSRRPRPSTSARSTATSGTTSPATHWFVTGGTSSCGSVLEFFRCRVCRTGSYVMAGGLLDSMPVKLAIESDGVPHVEVAGLETVRRATGL